MDEDLRALERLWHQSGEEGDRFAWLCGKLRLGADPEEGRAMEELMSTALALYEPDEVSVKCRVGYETTEPDPKRRLVLFSGHGGWWPTPDLLTTLETVVNVKGRRVLYPHNSYDTGELETCFRALFAGGQVFANFQDSAGDTTWGRSSSPLEGALGDWETSSSLALGATIGPLVGFLSVNVRDSL